MLREEGLETLKRDTSAITRRRAGLETLGLNHLVEEPYRLPVMNAVTVLPRMKEVCRQAAADYN